MTPGEKLKKTMIKKYGSEEAWKAHLREIGSQGGKLGGGKGGFTDKKLASRAGQIGGTRRQELRRQHENQATNV